MKVLLIDNYDSFTYNVYQYLCQLGADVLVKRNDEITLDDIDSSDVDRIVISPGPGEPKDAGISVDVIKKYCGVKPILGICLGHQAIAYAFGTRVIRARNIMHGKVSQITHNGKDIFQAVPDPFIATRYHSLVADKGTLSDELEVTAESVDDNEIMGLKVRGKNCYGIQFHPESILTSDGMNMLDNFLRL